MTARSRTSASKKSKKNARRTSSSSTPTTASAAPASTPVDAPEIDFARVLALIERSQLLAQVDAAARELEMVTGRAFFDHLQGRPVDPRITQRFAQQSSGWRVPWSASEPSDPGTTSSDTQVPEQVLPRVRDERPVEYVRLGRARSLRG